MNIAFLLLAAGASTRMGRKDKLLQIVDGEPLVRTMARRALDATTPVMVTLPLPGTARRDALSGLDVTMVDVPDAAEGMAASIRRGITACQGADAILIQPTDMPDLQTSDFRTILKTAWAHPRNIIRATDANGTPGHPVAFPADTFADLAKLKGDQGARPVLTANADRIRSVPLPGLRATTDLDTPRAWENWRRGQ